MEIKWLMILCSLVLTISVTTSCTTVIGKKEPMDTAGPAAEPAEAQAAKKEAQQHFQLAQQHFKAGELDQAGAEINKVLILDPEQPIPHLLSGDIHFAGAKYEEALAEYKQAAALDSKRGFPHVKIARTYVKLNQLDNAIGSYQTAIRLEPEVSGVYREYAQLCRSMGRDADAKQAEEKAQRILQSKKGTTTRESSKKGPEKQAGPGQRLDPALEKVVRLGDEFFKEDQLSLAIEQYRIAAVRAPKNAMLQQKLGDAYARKGVLAEAIERYQRVVELEPGAPIGYLGLGIVYSKMFNIETALAYFEKGLSLAPDFAPLQFELALTYYKVDRLDEAIAALEKTIALDQARPQPKELLEKLKAEKEAEQGFIEVQNEYFVLKYDPQQEEAFVNDALKELEAAYRKLSKDMAYHPQHKIVVKLYPGLKEFHEAASTPDWFWGGVASAKDYKMLLATPKREINIDKFPEVITHELTHVFTNLITFGKHPAWIHEGLAIYEAGQWNETRARGLRQAVSDDGLFQLQELEKSFTNYKKPQEISLAYAQAYAAVDYIVATYGKEKLLDVLKAFSRGQDFDEAAPEVFGMDAETFEQQWREDLERRYGG
jgi:tetratricopeptide (TPR) repeat protein